MLPHALRHERRVLMLVENLSVPFDRRVWLEACALRDAGLQVVVVCPRGEQRDREPRAVVEGIEIHRFDPRTSSGGALGYLREYTSAFRAIRKQARTLARERRFDVVHAASPPDFLLAAARSLKRGGCRFVFDHHDLSPELYATRYGKKRGVMYRTLLALERRAFRSADVVIATNESYRRIAIERGGKRPDDVFVVRNGPDLERFAPREPDESLKNGAAHLIAYVGMMGPQDGIEEALRALRLLRQRRDDWRAVFVGDGDVVPDMRLLATELGLDDVVSFTGMLGADDVVRVLATAEVCISPEPSNPLNDVSTMIKVGEYLAMGRAVVAFDLPETRATAGDAAVYAASGDHAAFAQAIDDLLTNEERRRKLGTAGRERAVETLSWDRSVEQLYAAYEHALGEPVTPGGNADDREAQAAYV